MTSPAERDVVQCEIRVAARPETVFRYFIDPTRMVSWKGIAAMLDPQAGGDYRVDLGDGVVMVGEYREVTPYRRVVFTFGWEGDSKVPPGSTTVEITLEPSGDETVVTLRHSGLPTEESRRLHGMGWEHYLGRLAIVAAGGDPGPHRKPGE